ncbi:MFS monocarboxylate transporter [Phyllosticta citribraziliensis]|uniref:MFS monocarboxylate transporter n=1 Tax=Phyllosticta citribraziliensis TaxID=989973 RepID=A0ABR1LGQ9_9PEZI
MLSPSFWPWCSSLHFSHAIMSDTPEHKLSCDKDMEPASGVATPGSRSPDNVHGTDRNSIDREDRHHKDPVDLEKVETARDQDRPNKATPAGAVNRILSKVKSTASTADPGPPPNGGWHAWTIALSGHATICATWGFVNSFGAFQAYYTSTLDVPASTISWIGTCQTFFLFVIGAFSGRATDYGLFRQTYILGVCMNLLGIFMTSICKEFWQFFLAQGVLTGLGGGLVFTPAMSVVATYFSTRRSLAIGIAASGSCTGGLIYPVMVRQLLPQIGFGWTVRVLGFFSMAISLFAATFLKARLPPRKSGALVDWAAFKDMTYLLYCLGMFLNFWGIYFVFFYISAYSRDVIGLGYTQSLNLLMVLNGVGYISRIALPLLSDLVTGPMNLIIPSAFSTGILIYAWSGVSSQTGLYPFTVIVGLSAAGVQGLFPAVLSSLTSDLKKTGTRLGMAFSMVSFACLTGPPLGGALVSDNHGNYLKAQMWGGTVLICGALTLVAARIAKTGWKLCVRI